MINLYAYTYPSAVARFQEDGFTLIKVGDSIRAVETRMSEQGGAAEWEGKISVGEWNGLKKIHRDHDVHRVLKERGLHHYEGQGTEWFKIPSKDLDEAFKYIDAVVTSLEGNIVRNKVIRRPVQESAMSQALEILDRDTDGDLIANLCPRFGKTIWGLELFAECAKRYGTDVMLLPAYWLSVHKSFTNELKLFEDFLDMEAVSDTDPDAAAKVQGILKDGRKAVVTISLHGDVDSWKAKRKWLADMDSDRFFVFADEGDFGTHTDAQVEKLAYILNEE